MDIERYVRWLQDVRRYQPSTVSRRLSVVVGFYRVYVIDAILPHSPADIWSCREADVWTASEGVIAGSTLEHIEHYVPMARG